MTPRLLLAALLAGGALTACTGGGAPVDTAATAAPTSAAPAIPTPPAASTPPASPAPSAPAASSAPPSPSSGPGTAPGLPAFQAVGRTSEQGPSGGPLTIVAARAAPQPGYDRVVLELAGKQAGRPGWKVGYVDHAVQDGSGRPVEVAGAAVLSVVVTGVGYPFDTGQTEASRDLAPRTTAVVREVDLQATFEGQFQVFVGVTRKVPFRVFRLDHPARLVVDLATS